jgi:hypothetical protein
VARSIELEWSDDALADLDRFAAFLHEQSPELVAVVAQAITRKRRFSPDIRSLAGRSPVARSTGKWSWKCSAPRTFSSIGTMGSGS